MAVVNREAVGTVECYLCGAGCTVHASKIGRGGAAQSLYYRCGVGSDGCGCIQPRGRSGQQILAGDMVPFETVAEISPEIEAEAKADEKPAEKPAKPWWVKAASLMAEEG